MSSRETSTRSSRLWPRPSRPRSSNALAAEPRPPETPPTAMPAPASLSWPLSPTPTRGAALRAGCEILSGAGIESAAAEAEWLLAGILGVGRSALHLDDRLTAGAAAGYQRALSRRARREPLQ